MMVNMDHICNMAIISLRPGASYCFVNGHEYQNLHWNDKSEKPTPQEYRDEVARLAVLAEVEPDLQNMPTVDELLEAEFKSRQKRRMLIGKARKALEDGMTDSALAFLLEAVEPTNDQDKQDQKLLHELQKRDGA